MSEYLKLEGDNYLDYGLSKCPHLGEQSVFKGVLLDEALLPPLVYEVDFPENTTPPHFFTGGAVIVSKQFLDLLLSCGVHNFQAFPAKLLNPLTGREWPNYFLFNVIGIIPAADLSLSDYDELMAGSKDGVEAPLVAFNSITIDRSKAAGALMFRLAKDPSTLIIHKTIDKALDEQRPEGGWGLDVIELDL